MTGTSTPIPPRADTLDTAIRMYTNLQQEIQGDVPVVLERGQLRGIAEAGMTMMGLLQQAMAADDQWQATGHIPMGPPTRHPRSHTDRDRRSRRESDGSFAQGSRWRSRSGRQRGSESPAAGRNRQISVSPPLVAVMIPIYVMSETTENPPNLRENVKTNHGSQR